MSEDIVTDGIEVRATAAAAMHAGRVEHEHRWVETTTMADRYRQWVCVTPGCGEHLTEGKPKPARGGRDVELTECGCPTNEWGDIRCHICGQYVNVRCWNCRTPRGEGPCPNPRS